MPDPTSHRSPAGALLLLALLLGSAALPAASALDLSAQALRVTGSPEYNPNTVQTYAGEVAGGPPAFDGQGIAIAVLDTGVDDAHPTFQGAWAAGAEHKGYCDDNGCFYDETLQGEPYNPDDSNGHGTHVASIALGRGSSASDANGEPTPRGIAPGARLVEVKVANSLGGASIKQIADGIEWVLDYNEGNTPYGDPPLYPVQVITLSMGTTSPHTEQSYDVAMDAVRKATKAGILVVVAAGNCGPGDPDDPPVAIGCGLNGGREKNGVASPGAAPEALTIGAMDDQNTTIRNGDEVAGYSSRGPNPADSASETFWRKPDAVAPGSRIAAACHSAVGQEGRSNQVCTKSGTSMAAPAVAGVAAILFQAKRVAGSGYDATPREVKSLILDHAEDWGKAGWDPVSGYGYVDAYASLVAAVNQKPQAKFSFSPLSPRVGEEVIFDASLTTDPDDQDTIERYIWDFGDGSEPVEYTGQTSVARHAFHTAKTYTVTLTVEDSRGSQDTLTKNIDVRPPPPEDPGERPVPRLTFWPERPRVGETVTWDASNSTDPDGQGFKKFEWDFDYVEGDFDVEKTTQEPVASYAFQGPGLFRVGVRVTDDAGLSSIGASSIRVLPPPPGPPTVNFTNPQEGDFLQPGPVLVSWITSQGTATSFTLYLDGVEDATLSARTLRVNLDEGQHTLRLDARGPGGTSHAWVNVTATTDQRLQQASRDATGQTTCDEHTHADGSTETHCTGPQQDECRVHVHGDGSTEEHCGAELAGLDDVDGDEVARVGAQETDDAPVPVFASLLAALLAAGLRRRRMR